MFRPIVKGIVQVHSWLSTDLYCKGLHPGQDAGSLMKKDVGVGGRTMTEAVYMFLFRYSSSSGL